MPILALAILLALLSVRAFVPKYSGSTWRLLLGASRASGGTSKAPPVAEEEGLPDVDSSFRAQLREYRRQGAPKKMLKALEDMSAERKLNQNMTVYALRTLQRLNRSDLSVELLPMWETAVRDGIVELDPAAVLLRSFCRVNRTDLAERVAEVATASSSAIAPAAMQALYPDLAYGHLLSDTAVGHDRCLNLLYKLTCLPGGGTIDLNLSKAILKTILREGRSSSDVRQAIRLLLQLGGLGDNDSLQLLTSSYMKSTAFVKGAVSVETLPPVPASGVGSGLVVCNEAAFIGRSNVGKSSLINMLSNRKGLAFTSKTPGKTSEFNYFDSNGTVGRGRGEKHRFFLVDLPGVGYAEASRDKRAGWLSLLRRYAAERPNLRVLFHLIDSRHGMLDADQDCLELLDSLPLHVTYCVVLTKADKRGGGMRPDILDRINQEIATRLKGKTNRVVPVLLSSSETREGGVAIWSALLDALASHNSH